MITWYINYCCLAYCRDTMSSECNLSPIFVYGTLKQGQPNHYLLSNQAGTQPCFLGKALTSDHWPLVIGSPYHIPFLLDRRGTGKVWIWMLLWKLYNFANPNLHVARYFWEILLLLLEVMLWRRPFTIKGLNFWPFHVILFFNVGC